MKKVFALAVGLLMVSPVCCGAQMNGTREQGATFSAAELLALPLYGHYCDHVSAIQEWAIEDSVKYITERNYFVHMTKEGGPLNHDDLLQEKYLARIHQADVITHAVFLEYLFLHGFEPALGNRVLQLVQAILEKIGDETSDEIGRKFGETAKQLSDAKALFLAAMMAAGWAYSLENQYDLGEVIEKLFTQLQASLETNYSDTENSHMDCSSSDTEEFTSS